MLPALCAPGSASRQVPLDLATQPSTSGGLLPQSSASDDLEARPSTLGAIVPHSSASGDRAAQPKPSKSLPGLIGNPAPPPHPSSLVQSQHRPAYFGRPDLTPVQWPYPGQKRGKVLANPTNRDDINSLKKIFDCLPDRRNPTVERALL